MDAVEAVRPLLPDWAGLLPIALWAPAACVIGWSTAALARRVAIGPYRQLEPGSPWVARARHAYPARAATGLAIFLAVGVLGVLSAFRAGGSLSLLPPGALAGVVCACAYLGGATVAARLSREIGLGARRVRERARDDLVMSLLLAPHLLLVLGLAPAIRAPLDLRDALLLAAAALLLGCVAWGGALRVLGWLRLTQPAPERLRRAVRVASQALGAFEPPVEVVRWSAANAFAYPVSGRLAFSSRCLDVLDDDELCAVAAHEIGHLGEPLAVRAARAAMLLAMLPLVGIVAVFEIAGPLGALGLVGLMLVLTLLFRRLAMRMEQRADRVALCGAETSPVYGRALERIYQANLAPAVMAGRPVHPHLYDRLVAAGISPRYPRPDPPSRKRLRAAIALSVALLTPAATLLSGLPILLMPAAVHSERASDVVIALEPGAEPLLRRALLEDFRGRTQGALAFARAASALAPQSHEPLALAAMALARQGRCEESAAALEQAGALSLDGWDDPWVLSALACVEACTPAGEARS